jgi:hypothetical protein
VADVIWVGMYDSKFQVLMTTSPMIKVKKQTVQQTVEYIGLKTISQQN